MFAKTLAFFAGKMWGTFAVQKLSTIFQQKLEFFAGKIWGAFAIAMQKLLTFFSAKIITATDFVSTVRLNEFSTTNALNNWALEIKSETRCRRLVHF